MKEACELGVEVGGIIECVDACGLDGLHVGGRYVIVIDPSDGELSYRDDDGDWCHLWGGYFEIAQKASDKYGPWQLATHDTAVADDAEVSWGPDGEIVAYRMKVEPKVKTVTMYGRNGSYWTKSKISSEDTHKITFNTIDGEPDCTSIKMDKL